MAILSKVLEPRGRIKNDRDKETERRTGIFNHSKSNGVRIWAIWAGSLRWWKKSQMEFGNKTRFILHTLCSGPAGLQWRGLEDLYLFHFLRNIFFKFNLEWLKISENNFGRLAKIRGFWSFSPFDNDCKWSDNSHSQARVVVCPRHINGLHKTFLRPYFEYKIFTVLLVGSCIMSLVDLARGKLDCPSNVETTNDQPAADPPLDFSHSCVCWSRMLSPSHRLSCCLFNGSHVGCNCLRSPGNQTLRCKTLDAFFTGGYRSFGGERLGPKYIKGSWREYSLSTFGYYYDGDFFYFCRLVIGEV